MKIYILPGDEGIIMEKPEQDVYLTVKEVAKKLKFSQDQITKILMKKDPDFPKPVTLSAKGKRFIESEIDEWLNKKKGER